MSATVAAEMGRRFAESQMASRCTIREQSQGSAMDPATGAVTPIEGAIVYSGPCRVRPASGPGGTSTTREAGGAEAFTFDYLVSVPFSAAAVRERHRVTIDGSPDPSLIGINVEVQHVDRGESITARRLQCREVV